MIKIVTLTSIHPGDGGEFYWRERRFASVNDLEKEVGNDDNTDVFLFKHDQDPLDVTTLADGAKECRDYQQEEEADSDIEDHEEGLGFVVNEWLAHATGCDVALLWGIEYDQNVSAVFVDEKDINSLLTSKYPNLRRLGELVTIK